MTRQALDDSGSEIEVASRTDVGQLRAANEDSCETASRSDGTQLLVVADGMGGHRGGATASSIAVATLREHFQSGSALKPDEMLLHAIEEANRRIFEMAQAEPDLEGMGTTIVAFVLDARGRGTVAHVGDSRAYRFRHGQLEPLTTDHSVVAEMQRRGLLTAEEAATHPRRNEILRSVGVATEVAVEIAGVEISGGDRFVLCSDGLSGVLRDDEIAAVVQTKSPRDAVETLVALANERGGPDNISVQILSVPASMSRTEPDTTPPVEVPDIGIEAMAAHDRPREILRWLGLAAIGIGALVLLYLGWISTGG